MANITFYEKTGCINNTKQKNILKLAGHNVKAISLITYDWTQEELLSFFGEIEPHLWFNLNAPAITSGEINPKNFSKEEALKALLRDHILIKRPLLVIGSEKIVGFDKVRIDALVGINPQAMPQINRMLSENLDDCPQKASNSSCN